MTLAALRLPPWLDPLIAEAKRRANRRRLFLAGVLVVVVAGAAAATFVLRSPPVSHRLTLPLTHRLGIARIPGMSKLVYSPFGPRPGTFCPAPLLAVGTGPFTSLAFPYGTMCGGWVDRWFSQTWVSSAAVAKVGLPRLRAQTMHANRAFPSGLIARSGPTLVHVDVLAQMSWPAVDKWRRRAAENLVRTGYHQGGASFTSLAMWTINGGVARQIHSHYSFGMKEFQFIWAAGTKVVLVYVFGGRSLQLAEAQHIAALAGPSK